MIREQCELVSKKLARIEWEKQSIGLEADTAPAGDRLIVRNR